MLLDYLPSPLSFPRRSLADLQSLVSHSVDEIRHIPSGLVTLRKSATLKAKAAIDDALLSMRWLAMPNLRNDDWKRISEELGTAHALFDSKGWLAEPRSFHETPPPPLRTNQMRSRSRGHDFIHLQFASNYEPRTEEPGRERWLDYQNNRTTHAWVLRHRGKPRPWIMCIHGYGMGFPFLDLEAFPTAWMFHQMGMNVVFPVLPLHGPRRVGWRSGERFLIGDWLDTVHAETQALWDLRRVISWIRAQDAPSVGVYGLSLGGYNAALLASVEPDLSFVIAGMPAVDFARLARLHMTANELLSAQRNRVNWTTVSRLLRVVSPLAFDPVVERERRFIFGGTADRFVPADQLRDLWRHWDQPKLVWYRGSHLSFRWEPKVSEMVQQVIAPAFEEKGARPSEPTPLKVGGVQRR